MSESDDIRTGLKVQGKESKDLALACGIGEDDLDKALSNDKVDDGIRSAYVALEVESLTRKTYAATFGRPVTNNRIQVIKFDDGRRDGIMRKKSSFQPKVGLRCEVEDSGEDDGWYRLVGSYRDNGVRLD